MIDEQCISEWTWLRLRPLSHRGWESRCMYIRDVHYMTKCIKYWLKLLSMEPGRYPKECYKMLLNFDSVGRKTWATDIRYILYSNGLWDAWQNHAEIGNTSKLHTYSLFKWSLTTEKYLDVINWKRHVKAFARFRCNNHNLAIERQRGILSKENRICKFCNNLGSRKIEDEGGLLLICVTIYTQMYVSYTRW